AAFRFRFRQTYCPTHSEISLQSPIFYVDTAPDNGPGLAYPAQCAAAKAEIHGRLPPAAGSGVATIEMCRWNRPRNKKHPYKIIDAVTFVMFSPSDIMQRILATHPQLVPKVIGDQCIDARTFIHFVEMRDRFPGKQLCS